MATGKMTERGTVIKNANWERKNVGHQAGLVCNWCYKWKTNVRLVVVECNHWAFDEMLVPLCKECEAR